MLDSTWATRTLAASTAVWELIDTTDRNKIASFAANRELITWSGTAQRDIASVAGATAVGVLEALVDHLACGFIIHDDHMKNGDLAYIVSCYVGSRRFYVKAKFIFLGGQERMHIFSAHLDR